MSRRSLESVRVVVTRAREQSAELEDRLRDAGARVSFFPAVAIADPETWEELDAAVARAAAGEYTWVLFTSANAVDRVATRLDHSRARLEARVGAVAATTAGELRARGIDVDAVPEEFTAGALAFALGRATGRVLLPRVEGGPQDVVDDLRARGWTVDEVVAYRNLPGRGAGVGADSDDVRSGAFDAVTFASGSAARNFVSLTGDPAALGLSPQDPPERVVACIGPSTARVAAEVGMRVDVVAAEHSSAGLVQALEAHYARTAE